MPRRLSRRQALAGLTALAGTALLAACGGAATATTSSGTTGLATVGAATSAAAPAGAASSSGAGAANAGVTLQYLGQGSAQEQKIYQTLADNFHKANPGIAIQVGFSAKGGAAGIFEQLQTLVAAGSGPDVYWTHSYIGSALYQKGVSMPLDTFLSSDKTMKLDDYYAAAYLDYTFDGKHTALPREIATNIPYYRTDLFDKAGLKYPDATWTWDDLRSVSQKLSTGDGGSKVFGFGGPATSIFMYRSMALANGSDIVDKAKLTSLYTNAPVVEAIQYFADFRSKDHSAATADELKANADASTFAKGHAAISFSGYYQISTITSNKPSWTYDVTDMPVNAAGKRIPASATSAHSAWSGTKHGAEAWQWLKYLSGEEASRLYGATGLVIPPLKSVAESAEFTSSAEQPKHRKAFIDDLATAQPFPIVPNWIDILAAIDEMLAPAWNGQKSAKEAIDAGNAKVDALLQKNR